ncbi:hypothetical protein GY45DRAFT_1314131 [Cubamyces sp. BRFM 1775]|nr:hypothetical protein GY45DRAFT_1314131 [Cubamyces sp. BRFM 1775]
MPLDLNGYTAHISSDGKELEAYGIQHEDDKTVTCWIASEEGKSFVIHYGDKSASTNINVQIFVDGRLAQSLAHLREWSSGQCGGIDVSQNEVRCFKFAPLVLTDDDSLLRLTSHEAVGTIRITFTRVQEYVLSTKPYTPLKVAEIGAVHEKSKKAGVHTVTFGERVKIGNVCTYTPFGREKTPFATFVFRYRPLELLQANGIVPLPPRPDRGKKRSSDAHNTLDEAGPSTNKRQRVDGDPAGPAQPVKPEEDEDEDDDADQVTFLREQMAMLQRRLAEAEASQQARVRVKREVSPIRVPSSSSHEVIDLT